MHIRAATADDWSAIWPFWHRIVKDGTTYEWDPDSDEATARSIWMPPPPYEVFVAESDGQIVGTYKIGPNRPLRGDHICNISYMVDPAHHGRGIGRALVEHSIEHGRRMGFDAVQFNVVVETNTAAVALYRKLGFEILATVPEAFRHPELGKVGSHIMYRKL